MDKITVGIDVSKDRLDVAVRPSGEVFVVARNAAGLEELVERLCSLGPHLVALEATGGFETVAAAALAAAGLPVVIVNPAPSPRRLASAPRPTRSMPASSPILPRRRSPSRGRCRTKPLGCSPTSWPAVGRSST
jgi:transposase